jgi:carboxymethylenebutenolidase
LAANFAVHRSGLSVEGHLAVPASGGPWPAVVVVHEIMGLTPDIRRAADDLAGHGYLALAIDLFAGGRLRCFVATMRGLVSGQGGQALDRIESARVALTQREDCTGKVGIMGFCLGGGFAILAAGRHDFDVSVPNYGPLPKDIDAALSGSCPMVASYGAKDPQLKGAAGTLESALQRAGVEHDVKEYPDSAHAFMTPHTGRWSLVERLPGMGGSPADAADAWSRAYAFMDRHLKEPG